MTLYRSIGLAATAAALGWGCASTPGAHTAAAGDTTPQLTLYTRLGGQPAIAAVVDDFVAQVAADSRINGRFANANVPRLKILLVEQVCQATGGPCAYTGRDMRSAHAGMGITDAEFNALVEDLVKSLDKFQVAEPDKDELLGLLGGLKSEVVGR
jgi:hemoglobin